MTSLLLRPKREGFADDYSYRMALEHWSSQMRRETLHRNAPKLTPKELETQHRHDRAVRRALNIVYWRMYRKAHRERFQQYRQERREHNRILYKAYYANHREQRLADNKLWRQQHAEYRRDYLRQYEAEHRNRERHAALRRIWRRNNQDRDNATKRAWWNANAERLNERRRTRRAERNAAKDKAAMWFKGEVVRLRTEEKLPWVEIGQRLGRKASTCLATFQRTCGKEATPLRQAEVLELEKEVVRLRAEEGLTFEQIGVRLGRKKSACWEAYRRASQKAAQQQEGQGVS